MSTQNIQLKTLCIDNDRKKPRLKDDFVKSIDDLGIIEPVIVCKINVVPWIKKPNGDKWFLMAGTRRIAAKVVLGATALKPDEYADRTDKVKAAEDPAQYIRDVMRDENKQREDLTTWEEINMYIWHIDHADDVTAASKRLGVEEEQLTKYYSFRNLNAYWKKIFKKQYDVSADCFNEYQSLELGQLAHLANYPKAVQERIAKGYDGSGHLYCASDIESIVEGFMWPLDYVFDIEGFPETCIGCPNRASQEGELFSTNKKEGEFCMLPACRHKRQAQWYEHALLEIRSTYLDKWLALTTNNYITADERKEWHPVRLLHTSKVAVVSADEAGKGCYPAIVIDGLQTGLRVWVRKQTSKGLEKPPPKSTVAEKRPKWRERVIRKYVTGEFVKVLNPAGDFEMWPKAAPKRACTNEELLRAMFRFVSSLRCVEPKELKDKTLDELFDHLWDTLQDHLISPVVRCKTPGSFIDEGRVKMCNYIASLYGCDLEALCANVINSTPEPKSWASQESQEKINAASEKQKAEAKTASNAKEAASKG